jgi:hypothetical protein
MTPGGASVLGSVSDRPFSERTTVERASAIELSRPDPGSFRDPRGRVYASSPRVLRSLSEAGLQDWSCVAGSKLWKRAEADGDVVDTRLLDDFESRRASTETGCHDAAGWLEHSRLPWISYPYEWSHGMLRDAALLQLDLLLEGLDEGLILRDGTPYNVQFAGTRPVLMDVLSLGPFVARSLWPGYRQFCETQLFPLLLSAHRGIDFRPWLRGSLAGISASDCHRVLGWSGWFRRGVFAHVALQDWLSRKAEASPGKKGADAAGARQSTSASEGRADANALAIVRNNAHGLRSLVAGLRARNAGSVWRDYDATREHYSTDDRERKDRFIAKVFDAGRRPLVWDLGCNTGRFSRMAARTADCVVAYDSDPTCVDHLYESLKKDGDRRVIPLVANLADTAGGLGWRGTERRSMYDRGRPATVLALAVIHHLVFGEGLPLVEVVDWLGSLADELVVEFVGPLDPMVLKLRARRDVHHPGYDEATFLSELGRTHRVVARESLCGGHRLLVHAVASGSVSERAESERAASERAPSTSGGLRP